MRLCATIGVFTPLFAVLFCSFWFRFGRVSGGFWCGCGFSLCLAVVRWAVDRRTAARATPVAVPVGVILGFSAGVFGLFSGVRLHALAYAVACAGGWFWCSTVFHAWRPGATGRRTWPALGDSLRSAARWAATPPRPPRVAGGVPPELVTLGALTALARGLGGRQ